MSDLNLLGRGLSGPYYPQGTWTTTPVSQLPKTGVHVGAELAYRVGHWAGTILDNQFSFSDRIANAASDRTPSSVKWWIHKNF